MKADVTVGAGRIVVMGVSGSGKTTVGRALAARLGVDYVEGDELHPPRNVALMAAGTPLSDDDRHDWLRRIADLLADAAARGRALVVSCSALKHGYRDRLRSADPSLRLVFLHGSTALLASRLQARAGHYMPASLLQSQLDTLEPPAPDEHAICADVATPPAQIAASVARRLAAAPALAPARA